MKAVILCAGYGERLKPLTDFLPKPLFPILERPLIDNIIARLKQLGVNEICINTHHLADKLTQYLKDNSFGMKIHIFYEPSMLGIAGGIGNMREELKETFIVYNGDVLTNIDLKPAIEFHKKENSIITLILHDYKEFNKIVLSKTNDVISIGRGEEPERSSSPPHLSDKLAFTGISIMSPEVFDFLPYEKYGNIHNVYTKLITGKLKGYVAKDHYWIDIGTPRNYLKAQKDILINKKLQGARCKVQGSIYVGKDSYVSPSAELKGFVSIGKNCIIRENVRLENCVVWDNIEIPKGKTAKDTIICEILE